MIEAGNNWEEASAAALAHSQTHPGVYVTIVADFGQAFLITGKALHVFAPTDSLGGVYWLNGKEKKFTDRQVARDSESTPILS